MYKFQCECAEIHGEYYVQSLLLWDGPEGEEWIAGDTNRVRADSLEGGSEHDDIILLILGGLSRIARKYDRELF